MWGAAAEAAEKRDAAPLRRLDALRQPDWWWICSDKRHANGFGL